MVEVEIRRGWRGETGCLKRRRHHHVRHCSESRRGARLLALFYPPAPPLPVWVYIE